MIERMPFGRTGHLSSRVIFGAAALGGMRADKAEQTLDLALGHGINHIDTAASYGDSELRLAPWLRKHRSRVFLASKTGDRSGPGAAASVQRSLERMGVEQLDLIQLHNLVDEAGWAEAFAPGGAVAALAEAKAQGHVRFLGVTGHGLAVARMHLRSLERFPFDAVLLPYNFSLMGNPEYAAEFGSLARLCRERGVAMQTIKSVARRRWQEPVERRFSWYEPLRDPEAIGRAVRFVLDQPDLFLNSSSDATLLPLILRAAAAGGAPVTAADLAEDARRFEIQPLFVPGGPQGITGV